jgi:hypothetical protein
MFARSVSIRLKPNSVAEFNRALENEILLLLRKQKGFRDELALVGPKWVGSCCNQFVGSERERGRLWPRDLSRSAEDPGQSG